MAVIIGLTVLGIVLARLGGFLILLMKLTEEKWLRNRKRAIDKKTKACYHYF